MPPRAWRAAGRGWPTGLSRPTNSMRHYPDFETFSKLATRCSLDSRLSAAVVRFADAGLGLSQDRLRLVGLLVRKRGRRREGRPLQLSGRRSVPGIRSPRRRGSSSPTASGRQEFDCGRSAGSAAPAGRADSPGRAARAAAVHQRRGRLCRLRRGPLQRAAAHPPHDDRGLPDLAFAFYDHMVVFDHVNKTTRGGGDGPARRLWRRRRRRPMPTPRRASTPSVARLEAPGAELPPADIDSGGEPALAYRSNFTRAEFEAGGREVRRIHPRRRHFPGGDQPAAGTGNRVPAVRNLSHAAGGESQPVHVLSAHAAGDAGRQLAGDHGPRGRWPRSPSARWPAPAAAAPTTKKTAGWPKNCWPIPRNGPST